MESVIFYIYLILCIESTWIYLVLLSCDINLSNIVLRSNYFSIWKEYIQQLTRSYVRNSRDEITDTVTGAQVVLQTHIISNITH